MSYQIPQQLEYKEKILFGLTAKQLAYALPAGLLSFMLVLKLSLPLYVSLPAVALLAGVAAAFMFFGADKYIINTIKWLKFRSASKGSAKLEHFVPVKDVQEDMIHA